MRKTDAKVGLCYRDSDFKVNPATKTHSPSQSSLALAYAVPSVHNNSEWTPWTCTPTDHNNTLVICINPTLVVSKSWSVYTERLVTDRTHTQMLKMFKESSFSSPFSI